MVCKLWVPEASLAGFLGGARLRSGRPLGPGKAFKKVGGFAPHILQGFPGPPGPARLQEGTPKNPARLPSGTQKLRFPVRLLPKPEGSRSVVLAKWFLEAWGTQAKRPHIFKKIMVCWPCRRRRQGQQIIIFCEMCGLFALVPQASQKTLGQKTTSGSLWPNLKRCPPYSPSQA
jgi:hypothetical protein